METGPTDYLINARWIAPVIPEGVLLEAHSLVISDGRISAIQPTRDLNAEYEHLPVIDLPTHLVTPGFINTHGHAAMTLLRGYADDLALMDWLNNHIWPVEGRFVSQEFVYDGTQLAAAEMLSTGTTCAADTYFFPSHSAQAFVDSGLRAQVAMPVVQFPNAWAEDENDHIRKGLAFHDQVQNEPLITTAFAPHAPYTVTDRGFSDALVHARALDIPIHLHLHETNSETTDGRPIERMRKLGLFDHPLQAVHMTQLTQDEITSLAEHNVHIAHCPESNMKLASGVCPVPKLLDAGVNVALGTDGAASNNNLDMLEEARSASLLAKVTTLDATSIDAQTALAMATINGARLLGLEDSIGSIEPGKCADLTAVDLSGIGSQPVYNPVSQLIYAGGGSRVTHTWVNGKCLFREGAYSMVDLSDLRQRVDMWQSRITDQPE